MRIIQYILSVLSLIFLFQSCQSTDIEISEWRGPNRDGIFPENNLLDVWPETGPELLWEFNEVGLGYSSAAVIDDFVFTAGTIDSISYVYKFDHVGNLIWKTKLGPEWMINFPGINSTPYIYDKLGYIQGGLGILYCFNAETGKIEWTKDLFKDFDGANNKYGITENFLIDGD